MLKHEGQFLRHFEAGKALIAHPHVHCVVTGGGISPDGSRWVSCRPGFFLPVRVLSHLFRRLFLESLEAAFSTAKLRFFGTMAPIQSCFPEWLAELAELDWVVYAKPPFGGPPQVIEYVGRYTHRVALSHQRLLRLEDGQVTFAYQDYRSRDRHKTRRMTVRGAEFIRRFLLHTLPSGFQRIRHYGLLAGRNKQRTLADCRRLLAIDSDLLPSPEQVTRFLAELAADMLLCPVCHQGRMQCVEILPSYNNRLAWDSS